MNAADQPADPASDQTSRQRSADKLWGPDEQIGGTRISARRASLTELRAALDQGALTSAELTGCYLDRIARQNDGLHAVIAVSPDALDQARAADQARTDGKPGPLHGIPILIKDNIGTRELPATAGSPALENAAAADSFLVAALRAAGAVILGKANLSEWANFRSGTSSSGWSTLGGQAVNPHGVGRSPSGSSSGSGVAVAAGLAPAAIGTETDGSITSPSSVCGIVGVKPTRGLISRSGIVPVSLHQDTAGPMTSSVTDAAILLTALAGTDPDDPATERANAQRTNYVTALDPGALAGARLGVWRSGSAAARPPHAALLDAAVARLRRLGAEVIDPVELPGADQIGEPEWTALTYEFCRDLNAYLRGLPGEHPGSLSEIIEFNMVNADRVLAHFGQDTFEQANATHGDLTDEAYREARAAADRLARGGIDAALTASRLDAVISLTWSPAWLTDYLLGDHSGFGTATPAAVAGYPSVSVNAGAVHGLPAGLSFTGPPWSEPVLLGLAYAFEQDS
jgi:amidase